MQFYRYTKISGAQSAGKASPGSHNKSRTELEIKVGAPNLQSSALLYTYCFFAALEHD